MEEKKWIEYEDLTEEQLELSRKVWIKHLNKICSADSMGNRPCGNGCMCDRCSYNYELNLAYYRELVTKGLYLRPSDSEIQSTLGKEFGINK